MTIILLLIILLLLIYLKNKEKFNNYNVYMDYRDLIDRRARFPYKISDTCFVDKFRHCVGDKHACQMCALEKCKGPPMISGSYPFF